MKFQRGLIALLLAASGAAAEPYPVNFFEPITTCPGVLLGNRVAFLPTVIEDPRNPGLVVAMPSPVGILSMDMVAQPFGAGDVGYWGLWLDPGQKFSQPPSNYPVSEKAPFGFVTLGYQAIPGPVSAFKAFPKPIPYRVGDGILAAGFCAGPSAVAYEFSWQAVLDLPDTLTPPAPTCIGNDINTVMLVEGSGPNGSILLRDRSQRNRTVRWPAATFGSTPLSYIQDSKMWFSGSAGWGAAVSTMVPAALETWNPPPKDDWLVDADNWTFDLLVTPSSVSQGYAGVAALPNRTTPDGAAYGPFGIAQDGATFRFGASSNTSSGVTGASRDLGYVLMGTAAVGVETHLAAVRSGAAIYLFQDGVLTNTIVVGTTALAPGGGAVLGTKVRGFDNWWTGSLRRVRLSNIARHTAAFTPPSGYCP